MIPSYAISRLNLIRIVSVFFVLLSATLNSNPRTHASFFLAFVLVHYVFGFVYAKPQIANLVEAKISTLIAVLGICISAMIATYVTFPNITPFFILHVVLAEVYVDCLRGFQSEKPPPNSRFFRIICGYCGLAFLARNFPLLSQIPSIFWLYGFLSTLIYLVYLYLSRTEGLKKEIFDGLGFELLIGVFVCISLLTNLTCRPFNFVFYHVFSWLFLTAQNENLKGNDAKSFLLKNILWSFVIWFFTPQFYFILGLINEPQFIRLNKFFVEFVVLGAYAHFFSSFFLSKANPPFLRNLFYAEKPRPAPGLRL